MRSIVARTWCTQQWHSPTHIITNGNAAAAAWEMSGTHLGDLPNLPATGKKFRVRASSIIEIRNGAILSMTDYWNPIQFRREVGLI